MCTRQTIPVSNRSKPSQPNHIQNKLLLVRFDLYSSTSTYFMIITITYKKRATCTTYSLGYKLELNVTALAMTKLSDPPTLQK